MVARTSAEHSPTNFLKAVNAGKFKPVYYFMGEDDYRIIEAEKYLVGQFIPEAQRLTNYRRFDGKRIKCEDLLAELSVYPMLGERQVFAVKNVQSYKPTEIDKILKLLDPPDPNRIIVLSTPADKKPKASSAFFRKISQQTQTVEFNKLSGSEASSTINRKLNKANLTIKPEALNLLVELVAGNRGALETETDKIVNFFESGTEISLEEIRQISTAHEIYGMFDIAEKLVNRKVSEVFKQLNQLISLGKHPTTLLFYMAQHFLRLYLIRNNRSLPGNQQWLARRYRPQAEQFTNGQLEAILIEMAQSDAEIRRGSLNPKLAMETMIIRLVDLIK